MLNLKDLEILKVNKPAQYLGEEFGICKKNWDKTIVKFALCYPDIYEIGMSYLGQKILYQLINNLDFALAERVYSPNLDMENLMRQQNIPLYSLETKHKLTDFTVIGFSLCYELNYTTLLNMLDLGKIPVLKKDRINKNYPLICVGGSNAFNPMPLTDFIDFFVIGDGEEVILEICKALSKNINLCREEKLKILSDIEGIYVPEFYKKGTRITKRLIRDLKNDYHPIDFPSPNISIVHDRVTVELRRGCEHGCRFCQAGMIYRPVRERKKDDVLKLIDISLNKFGDEECSLFSLSTTDYTDISEIIPVLLENYNQFGHSFSLPSTRIDRFSLSLAQSLQSVRKSTLTFAIEAGSDRLRRIINKDINESEFFNTIQAAYNAGWKKVKLYFIVGLPFETEEDLKEIVNLINKILNIGVSITITFSIFVPKPHTPFQWARFITEQEFLQKKEFLMKNLKKKNVKLKFHNYFQSLLEAILCLGDKNIGKLVYTAWKLGAKLDSWDDIFDYKIWQQAIAENNEVLEFIQFLHKDRDLSIELPWDFIDTGIKKEFLKKEFKKAINEHLSPSCLEHCTNCGVCSQFKITPVLSNKNAKDINDIKVTTINKPSNAIASRVRTKFYKGENVKFISHLDMVKLFVKALRRAKIHVAYSSGFNPQPQLQFSLPLPIGATSECEYVDIFLSKCYELNYLKYHINSNLPEDLKIIELSRVPINSPSIFQILTYAVWSIKLQSSSNFEEIIKVIKESKEINVVREKDNKSKVVNIKKFIKDIKIVSQINDIYEIDIQTHIDNGTTVKLNEIFNFFKNYDKDLKIISIHRKILE